MAAFASAVVAVSLLQVPVFASTAAKDALPVTQRGASDVPMSRPDPVSAMLTARSVGARVEDLSARTEKSASWANPDGTWTTDSYVGVQRFRDAEGRWRDVDLTLHQRQDGAVVTGAHVLGLRLPGAGRGAGIAVDEGRGRTVSLHWPGSLPKPTLSGTKARYDDVTPGVDMVVEALRTGYEQFFEVAERPAGVLSWDLPLLTKGLRAQSRTNLQYRFRGRYTLLFFVHRTYTTSWQHLF